ncbi:MAG: FAD-dependent oxidoreductase, partial [Bacteroidales bacterium]|nr:FAD-dependent oxidoreductase [Bacteroidales bacterium]
GLESAACISEFGHKAVLIERESQLGGHLLKWDRLFPDSIPSSQFCERLTGNTGNSKVITNSNILSIKRDNGRFISKLTTGESVESKTLLMTTGFALFAAEKKQEYGYNLYNRVITNSDLEDIFKKGTVTGTEKPAKIGFVHCVGSRDEKACNRNCSKVCCVTAVKQAIELKEMFPESEIFCFYMDLRMFGRGYEDLYLEAQTKYGIRFIRGRVSEVSEDINGNLIIKAEDTLISKPVRITLNLLVLMTGIIPDQDNSNLIQQLGVKLADDGFVYSPDPLYGSGKTNIDGLFVAGSVTGPKTLPEVINEARSTSLEIHNYLISKD